MAEQIPFQRLVTDALRNRVLPWARQPNPCVFLARLPPLTPPGVTATSGAAPLLPESRTGRWIEAAYNESRFPCLLTVLEGEADFRFAITRKMARALPKRPPGVGLYTISMPERTFCVLPPGVPYSDSSRPHWERADPEKARSLLLWMHIFPSGAAIHTCSTNGLQHTASASMFAVDQRLGLVMQALMEELQGRQRNWEALAQAHLATLLLRIDRALVGAEPMTREERTRLLAAQHALPDATKAQRVEPVDRACQYVETHLSERLTLDRLAALAYVSAPHLNRLFRAELGESVMQYVTRRRLEMAAALLRDTNLPVRRISLQAGYPNPEHFSRLFARHMKASPAKYRQEQQFGK